MVLACGQCGCVSWSSGSSFHRTKVGQPLLHRERVSLLFSVLGLHPTEPGAFYRPSMMGFFSGTAIATQTVAVGVFRSTSTTFRLQVLQALRIQQVCSAETKAQRRCS